jgi:hypothetical protein
MLTQLSVLLIGALLSVVVAWLVGNTLTARLEREKKLTERDVAALTSFEAIYGDFFAIWKVWGNSPRDVATRDRLLPEAARIEGRFEALLVMICGERQLSESQLETLGAYRQGLQQLREAMKAEQPLGWWSSNAPEYRAFKVLAGGVTVLLRPRVMGWAGRTDPRPTYEETAAALLSVTSNRFEGGNWVTVGLTHAANV